MFGFGSIDKSRLGAGGIKAANEANPVKLDSFGDVEFVDAWTKTCTIDPNGNMFLNGVQVKRIIGATLA